MSRLRHKRILLGVTAGIAAYKVPHLVRLFVKAGAEVRVVMTPDAAQFVTPQTLSVLSKNPVLSTFFSQERQWNNHVELGEWADVMVVAPLTANTLAKMSGGMCDNLLLATWLSARCKTLVAPAMDLEMYQHPTVKANLEKIKDWGVVVLPAGVGELASGLNGEGRMAEPEAIFASVEQYFADNQPFFGTRVLVNAGPTFEAIDPVRFIGNRSTGKMGIAIANAFSAAGAEVTLVLGPTHLRPVSEVNIIPVETAEEMNLKMLSAYPAANIVVCSAAVADYRPVTIEAHKIKKKAQDIAIQLTPNADILKTLGQLKTTQYLVGFALETEQLLENAQHKLTSKNADLIIANEAGEKGTGFGFDTNQVYFVAPGNKITKFELKDKNEVAKDLLQYILEIRARKK